MLRGYIDFPWFTVCSVSKYARHVWELWFVSKNPVWRHSFWSKSYSCVLFMYRVLHFLVLFFRYRNDTISVIRRHLFSASYNLLYSCWVFFSQFLNNEQKQIHHLLLYTHTSIIHWRKYETSESKERWSLDKL